MNKIIVFLAVGWIFSVFVTAALDPYEEWYVNPDSYTNEEFLRYSDPSSWDWKMVAWGSEALQQRLNQDAAARNAYLKQVGCASCSLQVDPYTLKYDGNMIRHEGSVVNPAQYPHGSLFKATENGIEIIVPKEIKQLEIPSTDIVIINAPGQILVAGATVKGKLISDAGKLYVHKGDSAVIDGVKIMPVTEDMRIYLRKDAHPMKSGIEKNSATFFGGGVVAIRSDGAEVNAKGLLANYEDEIIRITDDGSAIITTPLDIKSHEFMEGESNPIVAQIKHRINYLIDELNDRMKTEQLTLNELGVVFKSKKQDIQDVMQQISVNDGVISHIPINNEYDLEAAAYVKLMQSYYNLKGQLNGIGKQGIDGIYGPLTNGVTHLELFSGNCELVKTGKKYQDGEFYQDMKAKSTGSPILPWRITVEGVDKKTDVIMKGSNENIFTSSGSVSLWSNDPAFTTTTGTIKDVTKVAPYLPLINTICDTEGGNLKVASSVVLMESDGDPHAVNQPPPRPVKGKNGEIIGWYTPEPSMGLMQIQPTTFNPLAKELGIENADLFNPEHNVRVGVYYLNRLEKNFAGIVSSRGVEETDVLAESTKFALAAYNAGPNRVLHNIIAWYESQGIKIKGTNLNTAENKQKIEQAKEMGVYITWDKLKPKMPSITQVYVDTITKNYMR